MAKTERMELRLDGDMIENIDAWRSSQEDLPSRSEAVRRLLEEGLTSKSPDGFRPSQPEKLMLWMLTRIMETQIHERKNQRNNEFDLKDVDLIQQAIYGGHYWALNWEMTGVLHSHIDNPKRVALVVDIMDMWTFIERAYKGFTDAEKKRLVNEVGSWAEDPKFAGFDGNHEGEYRGIAEFLVKKLKRFEDFSGRSMNSHTYTVHRYGLMAQLFEEIRPNLVGRELNVNEVIRLLKREIS